MTASLFDPRPPTKFLLGPVAESVKDQHAKTQNEFRNLADSRSPPEQFAATGQPLTRTYKDPGERRLTADKIHCIDYHSFFYSLLSVRFPLQKNFEVQFTDWIQWENPRVTAISYLSAVLLIVAVRYLPALRFLFKALSYALACKYTLPLNFWQY